MSKKYPIVCWLWHSFSLSQLHQDGRVYRHCVRCGQLQTAISKQVVAWANVENALPSTRGVGKEKS